jgi:uncharacterized protein YbjT (DUF2867 family)
MNQILVIGGTGNLGVPVVKEMMDAGLNPRLFVRSVSKAQKAFAGAIPTLVEGDVQNKEQLAAALQGVNTLYLNLSVAYTNKPDDWSMETEGLALILQASKTAGVSRIVYLSSIIYRINNTMGFKWWVFDKKAAAIASIKASGIPYTIFYPSSFMESIEMPRQGNMIPVLGSSEVKMYYIAGQDYGKIVCRSIVEDFAGNYEYDIQGTEAIQLSEAAKRYAIAYPHAVLKVQTAPLGVMKFFGLFKQDLNFISNIVKALNTYPEPFTSTQTWKRFGKPPTTLELFAANRPDTTA